MLKKLFKIFSPVAPGVDLVSKSQNESASDNIKGVLHCIFPFAILYWLPTFAICYFIAVLGLYSSVFRHKSQGFFITLGFILLLALCALFLTVG